jgi:hypothetical protein
MNTSFEAVWASILNGFYVGQIIKKWGYARGFTGRTFVIHSISQDQIVIDSPTAKTLQNIPKIDFENIYNLWFDYISGKILRSYIGDAVSFHSSYIISIFHEILF